MLDRYTFGSVSRISPEAPVSVLQVEREESRPGGAGNAALNLCSLGQQVVVAGRLGIDSAGEALRRGLEEAGATLSGVLVQEGYQTPVKNRLIASNQQLMRMDYEQIVPLSVALQQRFRENFPALLSGINAVAIADYGKGLLTPQILRCVIDTACEQGIPVIIDPKGADYSRYQGATLIKPNEREAVLASGLENPSLDQVAHALLQSTQAPYLMITRAEKGISLFRPNALRSDFSTEVREVRDVTGAGDTVLATCTAALASQIPPEEMVHLANRAAGLAVGRFGCARISLDELLTGK